MERVCDNINVDNLCIAVIEQCIKDYRSRGVTDYEKGYIKEFLKDNIYIDTIAISSGRDASSLSNYIVSKLTK